MAGGAPSRGSCAQTSVSRPVCELSDARGKKTVWRLYFIFRVLSASDHCPGVIFSRTILWRDFLAAVSVRGKHLQNLCVALWLGRDVVGSVMQRNCEDLVEKESNKYRKGTPFVGECRRWKVHDLCSLQHIGAPPCAALFIISFRRKRNFFFFL